MGLSPLDLHRSFRDALKEGKTGIREHSGIFKNRNIFAGIVPDFDPEQYFTTDECETFDRTAQMGYIAAKSAMNDAKIPDTAQRDRIALALGTSHGGRSQMDRFVLQGSDLEQSGMPKRLLVTAAHFQQTSAVISKLDVHGPSATLSNACSSSGAAIACGLEWLLSGKCDYAIVGGADGFSRLTFAGFDALGAMADGPCAPFSEPVGLSLGDGAGFLVLETMEQAEARGATIHAELWGYGLSWDAYHITAPEPSGEGMNRAIQMAVDRAGTPASEIEYVNVHGTGTRSNDLAETVGLLRYFNGSPPPVSATKSQTGHMLGASSVMGVITSVLGMQSDWLPPTSNFTTPRSGCEIDVIPNHSRPKQWSCFMAQSAAFAGANAVVIGGKPKANRVSVKAEDDDIVISGMGVVSPLGCSLDRFADAITQQQSGLRPVSDFDASDCRCQLAGMVTDFNARKLMPTLNLRRVDRIAAYATIAASLSLQHAKLWPLQSRADRTGLIVGVARGAATSYERYLQSVAGEKWESGSAVYFPNLVMSSVGGQVSANLGIKGITSSLVGSTSAGLQALLHAWELFRRNPSQDAVVIVGADEIAPLYYRLFDRLQQLAPTQNGESQFIPYDSSSSGMVLGEGGAALVIERASRVRARGGRILAKLSGSGLTQDAADSDAPSPPVNGFSAPVNLHSRKPKLDRMKSVTFTAQGKDGSLTMRASFAPSMRSLDSVLSPRPSII